MRELSLFSGAGGGLLASEHLLGWETVGMVEWEPYCQQVLRQRQEDGLLSTCPIFSDVDSFVSEGFAGSYQGMVDVVSAGWPCQPHSVAGKREAQDDSRDKWPVVKRTLEIVRPTYFFGENVPGILSSGKQDMGHESNGHVPYFGAILRDLAEIGFDTVRYCVLGAGGVGAHHKRKRLWIVAYACKQGLEGPKFCRNNETKDI